MRGTGFFNSMESWGPTWFNLLLDNVSRFIRSLLQENWFSSIAYEIFGFQGDSWFSCGCPFYVARLLGSDWFCEVASGEVSSLLPGEFRGTSWYWTSYVWAGVGLFSLGALPVLWQLCRLSRGFSLHLRGTLRLGFRCRPMWGFFLYPRELVMRCPFLLSFLVC